MSTTVSHYHLVSSLIDRLVVELKAAKLYAEKRPSEQLLLSTQPFCCDTLSFEQWLQFVFVEKMTILIAQRLPLPSKISLSPMAEHCWQHHGKNVVAVIDVIKEIDELLSDDR